ncbi:MAG: hypothetical protein K2Q26_10310 [Bdellovibrionales bacterium]|nr:hypothetical protein [Bdellovibrionales bacterium]
MAETSPKASKDALRVALDKPATNAYQFMVEKIKAQNPCVKISPSQFVSFLVADFYKTYFEKDLSILVAEFFDSQGYHEAAIKRAKRDGNFDQVMNETMMNIKEIKSKCRSHKQRKKRIKTAVKT